MNNLQKEALITVSAIYRLLIASILSSVGYAVFFNIHRTEFIGDSIFPTINVVIGTALLIYFHGAPSKRISRVIHFYIIQFLLTFVPTSLIHTWAAWNDQLTLIERFPPITGIFIATLAIGLIMLPKHYKKYIVLVWAIVALPLISYLLMNPEELHTDRGHELLGILGPACILLYIMAPYQKNVKSHLDRVANDLKRSKQEADRDFLTDINNRRGLQNKLRELQPNDDICVFLIDVDHFKRVNDTFGHDIGDRVLIEIASRLRTVYPERHFLTRWGGEEFMITLINPKSDRIQTIAERFQTILSHSPYQHVGTVTVSLGVSSLSNHKDFETIVQQADNAMYEAKHNGRNQVALFSPKQSTES
ncbi:GGDEF domain-containing protein [Marinomonas mediterranea]|jgi:diguanylate cyclase (GGDEF) domain|uniref:diguanylate cyclase n=1 Tax=Marinomonas mediterranea (strain ATCC 700492 / JCM 21426 / NBRC 103028 / MMB-1) TaxID=717774 RepID=F2JYA4_MARM1|nr:GGDEF domain-containing protein [Marinomonas mediterranea]ADZ91935.1 diguanylate cyclase [Marinomonas mediterranea MMB-1]WCN09887.1 diguanylate cyclase [Marinomonas mediterranea]WCN13968.1 diguanylate cyclase [Marinomonas mediterranea]WCN18019.1 diguanylate cyclase [Marinomonas mediterranea MMB-1]